MTGAANNADSGPDVHAAAEADRRRREALDPAASVWVAASAGTGKTTVLTERLLSLMLGGTEPAHILCLTFTRAAAAEMANRLNRRLSEWATLAPGALYQQLQKLTGRAPTEAMLARARQLFARVLDTPGGARIATIHAFCQSLLSRFPLEAGVPPEFAVIEERAAREALAEAAETVIAAARGGRDKLLGEALAIVARHVGEEKFAELMDVVARDRAKVCAAAADGDAALWARLSAALSVAPDDTPDSLTAAFCAPGAALVAALRGAAAALAGQKGKEQQSRGATIAAWLDNPDRRRDLLDAYVGAFLTNHRDIRQNLLKAAAVAAPGSVAAVLGAEAERIKRFHDARNGAALREATAALMRLGAALLDTYERRKQLHGVLDYDDLVLKALELLQRPGIAPWVLFKLDGGIDHILIDEAQDTNPEQWQIVAALAAEFFAGEGAHERPRTVFAVGDVKQSIYSFQRADPGAFLRMRAHFQERVTAARQPWRLVPLDTSFRAGETLLRAIDATFDTAAADGVALDGGAIRHIASRTGHAGVVELWPPVPPTPEMTFAAATAAGAAALPLAEARTRLARAIAATIAGWLRTGERLDAYDREVRPGDVMVLVRRRNAFVADLVRALKQRDVPVAGVDRLVLTHQLAVQDLIALGQFLLLPEDSLTLATVLKGPLFDISEDELFELAYRRGEQSLWTRLHRVAADNARLRQALERLQNLLARADFVPPYELYAELLGAAGGRRAMLERLGPDAEDPIEEFLSLALAYERERVPSLQGFLRWLVAGDIEVKRDFGERQRDEVRILTVHGAKGLEAPIVFLPDTLQVPERRAALVWAGHGELPLWRPRADLEAPCWRAESDALHRLQMQEYRRLLYVALTRARDQLYVCGWQTRKAGGAQASWHTLCRAGWDGLATPFAFDAAPLIGERDGWSGEGLRLIAPQVAPPVREPAPPAMARRAEMPDWAARPPAAEPDPPQPLLPSQPGGTEPATLSPLAEAGRDRFKRGLLVHRLLQSLPELPAGERAAAARHYLALPLHALAAAEQDEICRETLAVLDDPALAELWGPNARAEVPVVGLIDGRALSGQIDRLVVTPGHVLIVDYKTLRPPPVTEDGVPLLYLRQLATYRTALRRIYPGRVVDCALLWTEGPRLMPVGAARLDAVAERR